LFTDPLREPKPAFANVAAMTHTPVGLRKEHTMKRSVLAVAAILAVAGVVTAQASTSSSPYIGSWKAHMTKATLINLGLVTPHAPAPGFAVIGGDTCGGREEVLTFPAAWTRS